MKHPFVSFCTDSAARAEDGIFSREKSHPRAWGFAARILGRYVREGPLHYSEGIPYVAVNGELVVDGGKITSARPGRILRGPGYKPRP